jgi:hypothetical protein
MSDLQDIITHNAHRAYEQGVIREQERILKLLEHELSIVKGLSFVDNNSAVIMAQMSAIEKVIARIVPEDKA